MPDVIDPISYAVYFSCAQIKCMGSKTTQLDIRDVFQAVANGKADAFESFPVV